MSAARDPIIVLVHSPLVGPLSWTPLEAELQRRGVEAIVPVLADDEAAGMPYWRHAVADAILDLVREIFPG